MKFFNITCADLYKIVDKLSLEPSKNKRRSPHPVFWYRLDGRKVLRTTLPNLHGGSGSISTGFLKSIRNNLRLTTQQFIDLIECPLTPEEFEAIVYQTLGSKNPHS